MVPAMDRIPLPAPLRDRRQRPALLGWLGVGLAVRLALMPLAVSSDLLAFAWRAHLIAYDGEVFGSYLVNMGAHYTQALFMRLTDVLLPPPQVVWTDPWWWAESSALAPQVQRAFSVAAYAPQTLFALKLPYLLADLAAGVALLALVRHAPAAAVRRAWAFWMLSPIGLYASYVFGRYEALPVVFCVLALLLVERDHPWWGALMLGIAITMRGYPLLLVPVFALVAVRGVWRQSAWTALALAPFALVMVSNRLLAGTVGELSRLRDYETGSTFFAYLLPVDARGDIAVFFLAAFVIYGVLGVRAFGWTGTGPVLRGELWLWLLVFHAAMFALATFSAHYFMWFTPFVAIALARRTAWRGMLWLHLAQVLVVLAIADLLGGPGTLLGLFEPAAPQLASSLPNLREALLTSPDLADQILTLLRTGFLALTLLLVWPAISELRRGARAPEPRQGQGQRSDEQHRPAEPEQRLAQQR